MSELRAICDVAREILERLRQGPRERNRRVIWSRIPRRDGQIPLWSALCPYCYGSNAQCRTCLGNGLVCPTCGGGRWVRRDSRDGGFRRAVPCPDCTDWHERHESQRYDERGYEQYAIDREREERAVLRWIRENPTEARQLVAVLVEAEREVAA